MTQLIASYELAIGCESTATSSLLPSAVRASFWEFTMQSNPMTWLIAALMALGALISFLHEPEGVQWLLLMWAQ